MEFVICDDIKALGEKVKKLALSELKNKNYEYSKITARPFNSKKGLMWQLEKTKGIYAFKSTSRKSVFTPTISDDFENEKSKIIDEQIKDLRSVKDSLYTKIRSLEVSLNTIKKRLAMLNDAETSIDNLVKEISPELIQNSSDDEQGDFEFIEENKTDDISTHGYNILMHDVPDNLIRLA